MLHSCDVVGAICSILVLCFNASLLIMCLKNHADNGVFVHFRWKNTRGTAAHHTAGVQQSARQTGESPELLFFVVGFFFLSHCR